MVCITSIRFARYSMGPGQRSGLVCGDVVGLATLILRGRRAALSVTLVLDVAPVCATDSARDPAGSRFTANMVARCRHGHVFLRHDGRESVSRARPAATVSRTWSHAVENLSIPCHVRSSMTSS